MCGPPNFDSLGDLLPHLLGYLNFFLELLFENWLILPKEGNAEEHHDAKHVSHEIKQLKLEPIGCLRDDAWLRIMVAVRVIVKLSIGDLVHVEIVQVRDQVRVHKCDPLHNYRKLQVVKFLQDNVEQPHDEHGQVGPLQEKYGFLLHNVRVNYYPLYQQLL